MNIGVFTGIIMKVIYTEIFKKLAKIDDMKDVKGRTFQFRSGPTTGEDFDRKIHEQMSGQADEENSQRLDDIWLDALRRQKMKEKQREPAYAFVIEAKKKEKWIPKNMDEGSFTEYCGGNVTEECIERGKNSPNKKTKQRANLADTFRHMDKKKRD